MQTSFGFNVPNFFIDSDPAGSASKGLLKVQQVAMPAPASRRLRPVWLSQTKCQSWTVPAPLGSSATHREVCRWSRGLAVSATSVGIPKHHGVEFLLSDRRNVTFTSRGLVPAFPARCVHTLDVLRAHQSGKAQTECGRSMCAPDATTVPGDQNCRTASLSGSQT
jgi:hypothetical protein